MGHETAQRLRADGHTVIGVDIKDADIVADLSTPHGREQAADGVLAASGGKLDGAVLAAGLGPSPGRERLRQIGQVNYFGVVELLVAWRPALAATECRESCRRGEQLVDDRPRRARAERLGRCSPMTPTRRCGRCGRSVRARRR